MQLNKWKQKPHIFFLIFEYKSIWQSFHKFTITKKNQLTNIFIFIIKIQLKFTCMLIFGCVVDYLHLRINIAIEEIGNKKTSFYS